MSEGFDAPATRDNDVLNRWPFAQRIYQVLLDTPAAWSVRVGVYGPWGTGKSTVLGFVEEQARDDGLIVVRFNPWAFSSKETMVSGLLKALDAELKNAGEKGVPLLLKGRAKVVTMAAQLGVVADIVQKGTGKVAEAAAKSAAITTADIDSAADGRRVLFTIDDLDRTNPEAALPLLWALREILDESGFLFVLGIDPVRLGEILSGSLGLNDGREFLEKIIDFPRPLPKPDQEALLKMVRRDIQRWCPAIPLDSLEILKGHLDTTPRKTRQFARQLVTLNTTLLRFGSDFDFPSFLLLALLVGQWPSLAAKLKTHGEEVAKVGLLGIMSGSLGEKNTDEYQDKLIELLDNGGVGPDARENAEGLLRTIFERARLRDWGEFVKLLEVEFDAPPLTSHEFRTTMMGVAPSVADLESMIRAQADAVGRTAEEVEWGILAAAASEHQQAMEKAVDSVGEEELCAETERAAACLAIIESVALEMEHHLPSSRVFAHCLSLAFGWIRFDNHECYLDLRKRESNLVHNLIVAEKYDAGAAYVYLCATEDGLSPSSGRDDKRSWLAELRIPVRQRLSREVFEALCRPNGIHEFSKGLDEYFDRLFFADSDDLMTAAAINCWQEISSAAKADQEIHANLVHLFRYLVHKMHRRHAPRSLRPLLICREAVEAIWDGAMARPLNIRMCGSIEPERKELLEANLGLTLKLPSWWVLAHDDEIGEEECPGDALDDEDKGATNIAGDDGC